jgi:large subunit ribosomal protein L29
MKKFEIAALSEEELKRNIVDSKKRIAEINFNKAIEPPQNPMIVSNLRKDVARMKTLLTKKQVAKAQTETK